MQNREFLKRYLADVDVHTSFRKDNTVTTVVPIPLECISGNSDSSNKNLNPKECRISIVSYPPRFYLLNKGVDVHDSIKFRLFLQEFKAKQSISAKRTVSVIKNLPDQKMTERVTIEKNSGRIQKPSSDQINLLLPFIRSSSIRSSSSHSQQLSATSQSVAAAALKLESYQYKEHIRQYSAKCDQSASSNLKIIQQLKFLRDSEVAMYIPSDQEFEDYVDTTTGHDRLIATRQFNARCLRDEKEALYLQAFLVKEIEQEERCKVAAEVRERNYESLIRQAIKKTNKRTNNLHADLVGPVAETTDADAIPVLICQNHQKKPNIKQKTAQYHAFGLAKSKEFLKIQRETGKHMLQTLSALSLKEKQDRVKLLKSAESRPQKKQYPCPPCSSPEIAVSKQFSFDDSALRLPLNDSCTFDAELVKIPSSPKPSSSRRMRVGEGGIL